MSLIFTKSAAGTCSFHVPAYDLEDCDAIPGQYLRDAPDLPDVSEPVAVRHYTNLSRRNFGVDTGMYPLGSCTMKYNPKINERLAAFEGFAELHPTAGDAASQGALQLMSELSGLLCTITGMDEFSLCPAAGAHGELSCVMMIKKYFEARGQRRSTILIPDSAHGTNPASVTMCGFSVKEVPSDSEGDVDLDALAKLTDERVAGMMLTSPNTLGLFDRRILQAAEILHGKGALFYCDGANLNALMGAARVRDMGFDLMHVNLHKTFSTPHGGGGPGAGPIGAAGELAQHLPVPMVKKSDTGFYLETDRPASIGRIHSFFGNFLVFVKAYSYIRMLGPEGIRQVSRDAVLNANYLLARLKELFHVPVDRRCMHEFVLSDKNMPGGITTNQIAKRILDYGFHAPTVYFPLIVAGAMMIEPTETESKETLDAFVEALRAIRQEADEQPERVETAPHSTPVKLVDAVLAARKPVLSWDD